jgi:ketosteroid isomerase-like protein
MSDATLAPTTPKDWIEGFATAWRTHDADLVASLFTEDGRLYYSPLDPPVVGREAIRQLWIKGTEKQSDLDATYGEPALANGRIVVEWWATVKNDGKPTTEPGCAVIWLNDDGLCTEMREYSGVRSEHIEPPENWLDSNR